MVITRFGWCCRRRFDRQAGNARAGEHGDEINEVDDSGGIDAIGTCHLGEKGAPGVHAKQRGRSQQQPGRYTGSGGGGAPPTAGEERGRRQDRQMRLDAECAEQRAGADWPVLQQQREAAQQCRIEERVLAHRHGPQRRGKRRDQDQPRPAARPRDGAQHNDKCRARRHLKQREGQPIGQQRQHST